MCSVELKSSSVLSDTSMRSFSLLTILWLTLCSLNQAAQRNDSEIYYITANSTDLCGTVEPCLTLSEFAANSTQLSHTGNTTLVFLPGTHYLSKINLTLSNVEKIVVKSESTTAQIECTSDSHIHFSDAQCVHIYNLEFIGCGGNQIINVEEFMVEDAKFEGLENSGTALELIETTAQIVDSTFVSNRNGLYQYCATFSQDLSLCHFTFGFTQFGGAIITLNSVIDISQSIFKDNKADNGGAIFAANSFVSINGNTSFVNNTGLQGGGAISSSSSIITINGSIFHNNTAAYIGGVLFSVNAGTITIEASEFGGNSGGVVYSEGSTINIKASKFHHSISTIFNGGVLYVYMCEIMIESSEFYDNTAKYSGGIFYAIVSEITMKSSEFYHNNANVSGGVLHIWNSNITIGTGGSITFSDNHSPIGAVIYAISFFIHYNSHLLIDSNTADRYAVIYLSDSQLEGSQSGNAMVLNNQGSLVAFNSDITFSGYATFKNNQPDPSQTTIGDIQEGGAITLFQSNVYFNRECRLEHNYGKNGGAIHSTESRFYVNGNITIAHNTAAENEGGVYISNGELNCQQGSTFVLYNNTAKSKGGGVHAVSSNISAASIESTQHRYIGARIHFKNNTAKLGGGLSLEANAKLYILKHNLFLQHKHFDTNTTLFIGNSADYGGAVYVNDDTNAGTCTSDTKTECFFQVLALYDNYYGPTDSELNDNPTSIDARSMYFTQYSAHISGSTLYGGLLDRCAVSMFAEVQVIYPQTIEDKDGISYFKNISNFN